MRKAVAIGNSLGEEGPAVSAVEEFWQTVNETLTIQASLALQASVGIDLSTVLGGVQKKKTSMACEKKTNPLCVLLKCACERKIKGGRGRQGEQPIRC